MLVGNHNLLGVARPIIRPRTGLIAWDHTPLSRFASPMDGGLRNASTLQRRCQWSSEQAECLLARFLPMRRDAPQAARIPAGAERWPCDEYTLPTMWFGRQSLRHPACGRGAWRATNSGLPITTPFEKRRSRPSGSTTFSQENRPSSTQRANTESRKPRLLCARTSPRLAAPGAPHG